MFRTFVSTTKAISNAKAFSNVKAFSNFRMSSRSGLFDRMNFNNDDDIQYKMELTDKIAETKTRIAYSVNVYAPLTGIGVTGSIFTVAFNHWTCVVFIPLAILSGFGYMAGDAYREQLVTYEKYLKELNSRPTIKFHNQISIDDE